MVLEMPPLKWIISYLKIDINMLLSFHSFIPFTSIAPLQALYYSEALPLQHGYCIGVSRRSAQATAGKGLAQSPYVAARAGVKPTTLRLKVIVSTKAPPRPRYAIAGISSSHLPIWYFWSCHVRYLVHLIEKDGHTFMVKDEIAEEEKKW